MSLYENKLDPAAKLPPTAGKKIPIIVVLLVIYISINTIINDGSYLAFVLGKDYLSAASVVNAATGIILSLILLAFSFGFIRHIWPPVLVSIFSFIGLARYITAEVVTTDHMYSENYTYLKYNEIFKWFGEVTGVPYTFIELADMKLTDMAIDSQRIIHISGVALTLIVCCLVMYFWYVNEQRAENSKEQVKKRL